jgi:hypothetical protein
MPPVEAREYRLNIRNTRHGDFEEALVRQLDIGPSVYMNDGVNICASRSIKIGAKNRRHGLHL